MGFAVAWYLVNCFSTVVRYFGVVHVRLCLYVFPVVKRYTDLIGSDVSAQSLDCGPVEFLRI